MVADMRWILATPRYASKFMPVRKPSRFLWRQILKRTRKNGDVLRPPPPVQRGHGSDGATRSEGSLMPLLRTLCRFPIQAAAHVLPTAERFSGVLGMFSSLEVKVLYPT